MPNIQSAKKRVRSSVKKTDKNTLINSSMKTSIKNVEKAVAASDKKLATTNLNIAVQRIDKAASNGLIHKNKAARLKSRLTKVTNETK